MSGLLFCEVLVFANLKYNLIRVQRLLKEVILSISRVFFFGSYHGLHTIYIYKEGNTFLEAFLWMKFTVAQLNNKIKQLRKELEEYKRESEE